MDSDTDFACREGWEELSLPHGLTHARFVMADPDPARLRIRYFKRTTDEALVGVVRFGPNTAGPPGHAHGGSMAAVLDEAMGMACWIRGIPVVAAKIAIDFRAMLPLGSLCEITAEIRDRGGRAVDTTGRIAAPGGKTYASGKGLFVRVGEAQIAQMMGK